MKLYELRVGQQFRFRNAGDTTVYTVDAHSLYSRVAAYYNSNKTGEVFTTQSDIDVVVVRTEDIYLRLERLLQNVIA